MIDLGDILGYIFYALFFSAFLFLLVFGLFGTYTSIDSTIRFVETKGIVTDVESAKGDEGSWNVITIQFVEQRTSKQITVDYIPGERLNIASYSVGQQVTILYDPGNPSNFLIKEYYIYLIPIVLAAIGSIGTFAFLRFFIRSLFRKPRTYPISS